MSHVGHAGLAIAPPFTDRRKLALLAGRPWPVDGHRHPTVEQATAEAKRRYRQFVARDPYGPTLV